MNTIVTETFVTDTVLTRPTRRSSRWLMWGAGVIGGVLLLALIAVGIMILRMNYVPNDLDLATSLLTQQGRYRVSYTAEIDPVPINQMQSWTLHLEDPNGHLIEDAKIMVDGDMPQHGHGLPTRPQVTRYLDNGDYLVEGLKFHMPGWWVVDFEIESEHGRDQVRFNLLLQ